MTDRDPDPPRGLLDRLRDLLELLAEMEREGETTRRGSGRGDAGPARVSFDYNVDIGGLGDRPSGPGGSPPGAGDREEAGDGAGDDPAIAVRETGDELLVTVDLPAGVGDDAAVDVDRTANELTVSVDGDPVARVPLDEGGYEAVAADLNNRVLEIELRRTEGAP